MENEKTTKIVKLNPNILLISKFGNEVEIKRNKKIEESTVRTEVEEIESKVEFDISKTEEELEYDFYMHIPLEKRLDTENYISVNIKGISPYEMNDICERFSDLYEEIRKDPEFQKAIVTKEKKDKLEKLLSKTVDEFLSGFSVRVTKALRTANIKYLGDLVQKTEQEMLRYKNFGGKSLNEMKGTLNSMGLTFGMRLEDIKYERK